MEDRELYQTILGLHAPWTVARGESQGGGGGRARVGGGPAGHGVLVSGLRRDGADVRSRRAPVAASRHLSVHYGALRAGAARPVSDPRRQDRAAVGENWHTVMALLKEMDHFVQEDVLASEIVIASRVVA